MAAKRFRLSTRRTGQRVVVNVYVYDTLEEMRAAASRFSPEESFHEAGGVTQHNSVISVEADGSWSLKRGTYIVRLQKDRLQLGIVTHEMNHAAVAIWSDTLEPTQPVADAIHEGYETLAYLQGDLSHKLNVALWKHGFYGEND